MSDTQTTPKEATKQEATTQEATTQEATTQDKKQFVSSKQQEENRIHKILSSMGTHVPKPMQKYVDIVVPMIMYLLSFIDIIHPYVVKMYDRYMKIYSVLPREALNSIFGLILCFFGSYFTVTIAAYEAFMQSGYNQFKDNLEYLFHEYQSLLKANEIDDQKDDDGDGICDVDQMSSAQLFTRKMNLFFISVSNPLHVQECLTGIMTGFAGVIAAMKHQFAKTVFLANSIGEQLRVPANQYFTPILCKLLPKDYQKWIVLIINYACKTIAITIAWTLQKVVSLVQSAIKGGLIVSRNMIILGNKRGYWNIDTDISYIDEFLGWCLAGCGMYFQVNYFFGLPFPLNVVLFPFRLLEYYLIWTVSSDSPQENQ